MAVIKNLLGSLAVVLFGLIVNKKINCLLIYLFPMHPCSPLKISENRKVFWCFQGVGKGCIGNKWVNKKKLTINYLLRNCYFYWECMWFRPLVGIPMGCNLVLQTYFYITMKESHLLKQKIETCESAVCFHNNEVKYNCNNIYPDELELKKENWNPCKPCFWNFRCSCQKIDVQCQKICSYFVW